MNTTEPARVRLSIAAKLLNVSPLTMRRGIYAGTIPSIKTNSGRHYIPMTWVKQQIGEAESTTNQRCAIYARESSSENKTALASQVEGLTKYATAKGYQIIEIVQEIGSGVNDERKKLHRLLKQNTFDILLVEHRDRLTRFGFHWFETICPFKIEVVNITEDKTTDLMEDLVAIITSFCARLYGQRRGRSKTKNAIQALQK